MSRVWINCFIMPSKLKDENLYRIYNYDGKPVEGYVGRPFVIPTHSATVGVKSKEQLQKEMEERKAKRKAAREERRRMRAAGLKPVWVKQEKKQEETPLLCMWGAMLAELYKEIGDRGYVALADNQFVEIKTSRIVRRENEKDATQKA